MSGGGPWRDDPHLGVSRGGRKMSSTSGWPSSVRSSRRLRGGPPLVVGVLKGAFALMSDPVACHPVAGRDRRMAVASYGSATTTSGVVRIGRGPDSDLTGRHVLVVEDIVDSGLTLSYFAAQSPGPSAGQPRSGRVAGEGRTGSRRSSNLRYVGFHVACPDCSRRLRPRRGRAYRQPAGRAASTRGSPSSDTGGDRLTQKRGGRRPRIGRRRTKNPGKKRRK